MVLSRFQGQKGNLDSGSKPKSELAQVMNKGIMEQRPLARNVWLSPAISWLYNGYIL